jgi:O-antigen/teichoic acid export membrane protein
MNKNIGPIDRSIRVILALIFAVLIVAKTVVGTMAIVLGALGVVFLLTAAIGFCPLYCPFKLSTLKKKE